MSLAHTVRVYGNLNVEKHLGERFKFLWAF